LIKVDDKAVSRVLFLNILSIVANIKPAVLYVHHTGEAPSGPFWNMTLFHTASSKSIIKTVKVVEPVLLFGRVPSLSSHEHWYNAHTSDIIRMNVLSTQGGIYLDLDMLVLRSFDDLLSFDCTLGEQYRDKYLSNAVILSSKSSTFLRDWFATFSNANFSTCWDCHSVQVPSRMWRELRLDASRNSSLNVLPLEYFYEPSFSRSDLHELYKENKQLKPHQQPLLRLHPPYNGKYAQHLWHSVQTAHNYLKAHKLKDVCNSTSMYNQMLRYALRDSPWLKSNCGSTQT